MERQCDICKNFYDTIEKNLGEHIASVYVSDYIRFVRRERNKTHIIDLNICPNCADDIERYINTIWRD